MLSQSRFPFLSDCRARTLTQTILLVCLLFVRFCYPLISQSFYVIASYILSFLFILTITKNDRHIYNLTRLNKKEIIVGCFIGLFCLVLNVIITRLFFENTFAKPIGIELLNFSILLFVVMVILQFPLNALPEELLFRGFLWGHSRRFKLSNLSILLIQAILFWGAHYYYFDRPWIWIRVMVAGLIFGIVAWKTQSLFISAVAHACWNSAPVFFDSRFY